MLTPDVGNRALRFIDSRFQDFYLVPDRLGNYRALVQNQQLTSIFRVVFFFFNSLAVLFGLSITAQFFFFRYYLSWAVCMYMCVYVFEITATIVQPRTFQLWHNIPYVKI